MSTATAGQRASGAAAPVMPSPGDTVTPHAGPASTPDRTLAGILDDGGAPGLNLVRLVLALLVIVSHAWPLGGFGAAPALVDSPEAVGSFAVACFVALSGVLVTRAALRSSVPRFLWHRALRLFPAYWLMLIVGALVIGPASYLVTGHLGDYSTASPAPLEYITQNWWLATNRYGIGDVFLSTPWGQRTGISVINGVLWSLKYEFAFYLVIAGLGLLTLLRRRAIAPIAASVALSAALLLLNQASPIAWLAEDTTVPLLGRFQHDWLVALWLAFGCGAMLALRAERVRFTLAGLGLATALLIAGLMLPAMYSVLAYPTLGYLLVALGTGIRGRAASWCRANDLSYGTYLIGFPVMQALAASAVGLEFGAGWLAALTILATLPLAYYMWHFVERRALDYRHLGRATAPRPVPVVGDTGFEPVTPRV